VSPKVSARIDPDYRQLAPIIAQLRREGKCVALANGCFDILHVGHVRLLYDAQRMADLLILALNSDKSVRLIKGSGRPIVPLRERMEVVAALSGVDFVTSFAEPTADAMLECLRPDLLVKGTDRQSETIPESQTIAGCKIQVAICGDPKQHSSSTLSRKLWTCYGSPKTA